MIDLHPPWAAYIAYALALVLAAAAGWLARSRREALQLQHATIARLAVESSRHSAVIDSAPYAVISIDAEQRIVLFNPAAERMLRCSAAEALGSDVSRFVPPGSRDRHRDFVAEFAREGVAHRAMSVGREVYALRGDGSLLPVEATVSQVAEPGSQGQRMIFTVVLRDITEAKVTQARLYRVQQRYRTVVEQSPEAIWVAEGSRIVLANPACVNLLGALDESELVGQDLGRFFRGASGDALREWLRAGPLGVVQPISEQRVTRLDGAERDVEISVAHVPDHGGVATQLVMRDITERKRATDALLHSREELRRLSAGLTAAREEERRHFSRELHDELGQRLSAIKMELSSALAAAAGNEVLQLRLRELLRDVDATVTSVRRIAADLRPAMLDDLGLDAAVEWLASDWAARSGLDIGLDCQPLDHDLSDAAKTAVFRIVQEALTNVARHAQATRVRIALRRDGNELLVRVADNGQGLAPGATDKRGSHGLMGIRERARLLGGQCAVHNPSDGGCEVEVRLPLDRIDSGAGGLQESTA